MKNGLVQQSSRLKSLYFPILLPSRLFSSLAILAVAFPLQAANSLQHYDLDQAIEVALENNRLRSVSQHSVAIAEAQYRQARSSYWPILNFNMGYHKRDEVASFEYPELHLNPAPGLLPPVTVPAQDIPLLGRNTSHYSLDMTYPLYTGGKRSSLIEQARISVDFANQELRRTDLQVVQDVKRYYYAALYTQQLVELAEDISLTFEVLKDITQAFFEGGSNSVDKLDLLQSRLSHSIAKATLSELRAKHQAALAALSFSMGLEWREEIALGSESYPATLGADSLDRLINQALNFNPEIEQMTLAVEAYEAKVDEAKSDHHPTLALLGSYDGFNNDLDTGLDIEANRRSWKIGIGLQINLFAGGRTRHKVSAAKSELAKKEQQQLLVSDAVATEVKSLFLQIQAAQQQIEITERSLATSRENRDLTDRAYRTGAVETQEVIKASLFDAMIRANHYRARHDHALHLAEITYLLGREAVD